LRRFGRTDHIHADILFQVYRVDGERGLLWYRVDTGVVEQVVDFGSVQGFAGFGGEREN